MVRWRDSESVVMVHCTRVSIASGHDANGTIGTCIDTHAPTAQQQINDCLMSL